MHERASMSLAGETPWISLSDGASCLSPMTRSAAGPSIMVLPVESAVAPAIGACCGCCRAVICTRPAKHESVAALHDLGSWQSVTKQQAALVSQNVDLQLLHRLQHLSRLLLQPALVCCCSSYTWAAARRHIEHLKIQLQNKSHVSPRLVSLQRLSGDLGGSADQGRV